MSNKALPIYILVVIFLVLLGGSFFTVPQGESALKLRLGELVRNSQGQAEVYTPGLHFKLPFVNTVRYLNMRLQSLNVDSSRVYTAEQKSVLVDYYAKWRISDLSLYYTRTGGYALQAQQLLTQKINDALRAAIGKRTIKDVVSSDREAIMQILNKNANQSAKDLGIKVVDVRIQGIELPAEVQNSVFDRMRTERKQVATKHRSQGQASAETIRADTDAQVTVTEAKANAQSQAIRAAGDKEAALIYIEAYNQDPAFYALYRSLDAYQHVFKDKNTIMVLKPNSEFFKYFNKASSHG